MFGLFDVTPENISHSMFEQYVPTLLWFQRNNKFSKAGHFQQTYLQTFFFEKYNEMLLLTLKGKSKEMQLNWELERTQKKTCLTTFQVPFFETGRVVNVATLLIYELYDKMPFRCTEPAWHPNNQPPNAVKRLLLMKFLQPARAVRHLGPSRAWPCQRSRPPALLVHFGVHVRILTKLWCSFLSHFFR